MTVTMSNTDSSRRRLVSILMVHYSKRNLVYKQAWKTVFDPPRGAGKPREFLKRRK
jgi:hypothetical protein